MDVTRSSWVTSTTTFHTFQLPSQTVTGTGAPASANQHAHNEVSQSATSCVQSKLHARTWSTDSGFDTSPLQSRNTVNGSLDVLHEDVPVQVKQAEGKFIRHLHNKNTDFYRTYRPDTQTQPQTVTDTTVNKDT